MKIGFIVGKMEEIYNDKNIKKQTPKKYLVYDDLNSDVAMVVILLVSSLAEVQLQQ